MLVTVWYVVIGLLLVGMALSGSVLKRLPLSTSMLYLMVGVGLGPSGFGLIRLDPVRDSALLERLAEVAVIVSLFTAGLKLRIGLRDALWQLPLRLASGSMVVTIGLVSVVGVVGLGLSWGAAILLGAILAPTDPVLASDVQMTDPTDRDRLRFALTGEAGLNDGAAFPFIMLGLGLLGLHDVGSAWRWLAVDLAWAVGGGLAIGMLLGGLVARIVLYLRRTHKEAVGLDDFLALGLIALSYGTALLAHTYGFLAVFAAGLALRRVERKSSGDLPLGDVMEAAGADEDKATHPEKAAVYMAESVLGFNEQLERILEVGMVVLLGGMISLRALPAEALWFVPLLLLVLRPVSVLVGLLGSHVSNYQRTLIGWFGIRGIGSIYYLMYAIEHGLSGPLAQSLVGLTLTTVAVSIVVHGVSVTPLMNRYQSHVQKKGTATDGLVEPAAA